MIMPSAIAQAAPPLPASPTRGEVSAGGWGTYTVRVNHRVMPAQPGIQGGATGIAFGALDSRLRGNDTVDAGR